MTSGLVGAVHHCSHLDLAARLTAAGQRVDALIVDAPYSARTHAGHDEQAAHIPSEDGIRRRRLQYPCWTQADVRDFVEAWAPIVNNWVVSITDEDLRGAWREECERAGLLGFARIPAIETGATVRFNGDGAANWTTDIVTARTRDPRHQGIWRPRSYHLGPRETKDVVGGKPLWLMRALVRDYSRPGDLVCDPCAGAGTTLVAAKMSGRRFVGSDIDAAHIAIAQRLLDETTPCDARGTPIGGANGKSLALFGGG